MAVEPSEISELVVDALEKAIQQEGEIRLLAKGAGKPGLLAGGKLTAAKQKAIDQCLDPSLAWFSVREAEEGKGKTAGKVQYLSITRPGVETLFARRSPAERIELLEKCANPHKEAANDALLRLAEIDLKAIDQERARLEERDAALRGLVQRIASVQIAALEQDRIQLERRASEVRSMSALAEQTAIEKPAKGEPQQSRVPIERQPVTEGDADYQRSLARELVFAWQDSSDSEARAVLERVMMNAGLDRIGEAGDQVSFDGRDHHTESDLLPGHPAVIVEPGWQLVSPRGTMLIAPAQVASANEKEVGDAAHAQH